MAVAWLVSATSTGVYFAIASGHGVVLAAGALAVLLLLALLLVLRCLWDAAHPRASRTDAVS